MFKKYSSQLLYFSVTIAFFLTFATVYGVYGKGWPMAKSLSFNKSEHKTVKPTIRPNTVIKKEIRYVCGDKVATTIPTTSDLVGSDFLSMVKRFPPEQGWSIDDTVKNSLVLVRTETTICPYHRDFRHLGVSDGYLVVYEGPMGFNQKILQREEISLSSLLPEMQSDLNLVMTYERQPADVQGRLKIAYEFETEAQLNTVLENFDEFRE